MRLFSPGLYFVGHMPTETSEQSLLIALIDLIIVQAAREFIYRVKGYTTIRNMSMMLYILYSLYTTDLRRTRISRQICVQEREIVSQQS